MNKSEKINELATALVKAQAEFGEPKRTKEGYGYFYAPMEEVRRAVIKPLTSNGLSVVQLPCDGDNLSVSVSTMLVHTSGQFIEASYKVKPSKNQPQDMGGAITYLRRYALMAVLGLAPEDDDARNVSTPNKKPAPKALTTASVVFGVSDSDKKLLEEINQLLEVPSLSEDNYKAIVEGLSRASTTSQYQELKKRLLEKTNE